MDKFDAMADVAAVIERGPLEPTALPDTAFAQALEEIIPHLRGYARSLAHSSSHADDLVQDALLRAWSARARFQAGVATKLEVLARVSARLAKSGRRRGAAGEGTKA